MIELVAMVGTVMVFVMLAALMFAALGGPHGRE